MSGIWKKASAIALSAACVTCISGCGAVNVQDKNSNQNDNVEKTANDANANVENDAKSDNGNTTDNTNTANTNVNANANINENANDLANDNVNAPVSTEPVSLDGIPTDINTPIFVQVRHNFAWGFTESFTLYYPTGDYCYYDNKTGEQLSKDRDNAVTPEIIATALAEGKTDKAADPTQLIAAYREAAQANFNAEASPGRHMANDFGSISIYVLGNDGQYHWICTSGDSESHLEDEHVALATELFSAF